MKKQASARLKNKIKHLVARSIAQMERNVEQERHRFKQAKKNKS
jgi:hypothetical protein